MQARQGAATRKRRLFHMKATVIVTLKPTVLDPQGMTIQRSVASLGLAEVSEIRQGKYFDINLKDSLPADRSRQMVERLAKEVLTNPVIEQYRIVWE
jgi:phosphoribosylformylglycinamidine synthase PurS subunit